MIGNGEEPITFVASVVEMTKDGEVLTALFNEEKERVLLLCSKNAALSLIANTAACLVNGENSSASEAPKT